MSSREKEDRAIDKIARWPQKRDGTYHRRQRPPQRPDEQGAICVIDDHLGGRTALFAIPGDTKYVRVENLP